MKKNLTNLLLAPLFFFTLGNIRSQTINDLMTKLDTTNGINLSKKRKLDLYNSLKENPDSVKTLYNFLDNKLSQNPYIGELKINKTDIKGFDQINGYGVDFDPESLGKENEATAVICSTTFCGPCKKLASEFAAVTVYCCAATP